MKNHFLILCLFLLSVKGFSQEVLFSAQVIDSESKEPVYGAHVFLNDNAIASTDNEGFFRMSLQPESIKKLCISHITHETICYDNFSDIPQKILIKPSIEQLSEVVIYDKKGNKDDFIKKLREVYKKTSMDQITVPYNLKILYFNDKEPQVYTESEGIAIVPKILNRYIFDPPHWSNCNLRVIDCGDPKYHYSGRDVEDYRFYQANHPLLKKKKFYTFEFEEPEYINGKEYWVVSFRQKRKIKNERRYFVNIKGKMWIDPNNYNISKEIYSLDFEDIYHVKGTIFYSLVNGYNIMNKLTLYEESKRNDPFLSSVLEFYIPQFLQDQVILSNIEKLVVCYNKELIYDKEFWADKPITKKHPFYKDLEIMRGKQTFSEAFEASKGSRTFENVEDVNKYTQRRAEKGINKVLKKYNRK